MDIAAMSSRGSITSESTVLDSEEEDRAFIEISELDKLLGLPPPRFDLGVADIDPRVLDSAENCNSFDPEIEFALPQKPVLPRRMDIARPDDTETEVCYDKELSQVSVNIGSEEASCERTSYLTEPAPASASPSASTVVSGQVKLGIRQMSENGTHKSRKSSSEKRSCRFRPRKGHISAKAPTPHPDVAPSDLDEKLMTPFTTKTTPKNDPFEISEFLVLNLSGLSGVGRLQFRIDASAYSDLVEEAYREICLQNRNFSRSVSPAMFDYYCFIAYWLRVYFIRQDYQRIRALFPDEYPLPGSLTAYLSGLGRFTDPAGRQFEPNFELLSNVPHWHGFRGSFGNVENATVDHYTSGLSLFPVIYRLYAETAPAQWIDKHHEYDLPGAYQVKHAHPNRNLGGWRPLVQAHPDAVRELRRLNVRASANNPDDRFIQPLSVPAHYEGVDYISGLAELVAQRLTTGTVIRLNQLPFNTIGSSSQIGFNEVGEFDQITRETKFSEGEVTGYSAHQLSVKVGNSISIMRYRIRRNTTNQLPRPEVFPYTFEQGHKIPAQWHEAARRYFEFGGQARWNFDDFSLPTVSGKLISCAFTRKYIE